MERFRDQSITDSGREFLGLQSRVQSCLQQKPNDGKLTDLEVLVQHQGMLCVEIW